jgi:hypothetical protein
MSDLHPDRAIEDIARRQHGVFRRNQAVEVGYTARMIERRVMTEAWIRLERGLYALKSHPYSWLRQAKAAELSIPGAIVSHRAAALLHGVPGLRPGRIDITVPPGSTSRSRFATVHRRILPVSTVREGIRVTTLGRTVFDLAGHLPPLAARDLVHDLVVRRLITMEDLRIELARIEPLHPRGLVVVRELLDDEIAGRVPPANVLERALSDLLDDPRLPAHTSQATPPWWPAAYQRVDEFIGDWRRIVEVDGRLWHTREADFERDRARDHVAQRHGCEVTRFTHDQVINDPDYALGVLLDIGRCRAA